MARSHARSEWQVLAVAPRRYQRDPASCARARWRSCSTATAGCAERVRRNSPLAPELQRERSAQREQSIIKLRGASASQILFLIRSIGVGFIPNGLCGAVGEDAAIALLHAPREPERAGGRVECCAEARAGCASNCTRSAGRTVSSKRKPHATTDALFHAKPHLAHAIAARGAAIRAIRRGQCHTF